MTGQTPQQQVKNIMNVLREAERARERQKEREWEMEQNACECGTYI